MSVRYINTACVGVEVWLLTLSSGFDANNQKKSWGCFISANVACKYWITYLRGKVLCVCVCIENEKISSLEEHKDCINWNSRG